ncbi:MAG: nitronate monooxygenase [Solirubrobacteraceae bacterium]
MPLLQGVLDAVSVPVLAAGGITAARGLAAVLAAGAAGAWLGTVFAACAESMLPEAARRRIVAASATPYAREHLMSRPAIRGPPNTANGFSPTGSRQRVLQALDRLQARTGW